MRDGRQSARGEGASELVSMAFFRTINFADPLPSVVGEGVILRTPQATDHAEWAALARATAANFSRPGSRPGRPTI